MYRKRVRKMVTWTTTHVANILSFCKLIGHTNGLRRQRIIYSGATVVVFVMDLNGAPPLDTVV